MREKRIDAFDMAYEEYSHEVLGFFDTISSGNPTLYGDLIVSTTFSTLTLFGNSDFLLEEVDAFLAIEDDPTSLEFYQPYLDPRVDILLLEAFLNDDPSLPPLNKGNYLPEVHKELKICDDKLPVIIAKDLSVEEKTALITVLKSHKQAIAWKISDIKGIDPKFYTHKILMEEDFEPAVQHQRRVNPKIHDVIKQEVIKLFEAGLIDLISDSPWVSMVHCVPKKGGFTVVENEDNELIPTRLVTSTFQRCMMASFHDMIEKTMEVFMDDFFIFGNSFQSCLSHLERMLKRCEDTNLCLNYEKSHFMVKEGIVLGHKISKQGIDLDDALWAFRTAYKTPIRCTPHKLVYRKACHLPIELEHKAYWALKHVNFDLKTTGDHRKVQINKLNELCDQAYENSLVYKEKTKRLHDSKIKNRVFNIGDRVLLFNSCLKIFLGKLKSHWPGPFTISQVYPYGSVELSQTDGPNFKVNGHRVKHYFREDIPKVVVLDLQTFPRDH
uniref:Reverse transcriptase domain-containing protein n=1 Tax=Tanacetum cinerariifolium TaxID=118510 RepID=A0A6L2LGJ1_TANCI|nr:reverse transcriptase domain-containing protein [Tanacetum cinerariifolium]